MQSKFWPERSGGSDATRADRVALFQVSLHGALLFAWLQEDNANIQVVWEAVTPVGS